MVSGIFKIPFGECSVLYAGRKVVQIDCLLGKKDEREYSAIKSSFIEIHHPCERWLSSSLKVPISSYASLAT